MKYVDIHSHLNLPEFKDDFDLVLKRMKDAEVGTITIGLDKESSKNAVSIAEQNDNVWACIGQHPEDSSSDFFDEEFFEELIKSPKVVCVGECGLDYFRLGADDLKVKEKQKEIFVKHIDFAVRHNKPLMLHVRSSPKTNDAHIDALKILEEKKLEYGLKLRGNSHFFTSKILIAEKYFNLGFTISFTGLITYVRDFDKVIKMAPINMIHIETDAPLVPPVPFRGGRNEPSYVVEVFKKIAEIKGLDEEELRENLLKNAKSLFNLNIV